MPSQTFFNLPQEKRSRLLRSAWAEFIDESYSNASINRIVQRAGIPRGSFYQYFTNKEDLFSYLLLQWKDEMMVLLKEQLLLHRGDVFAALLSFYDRLVCIEQEGGDNLLCAIARIGQNNPNMNLDAFFPKGSGKEICEALKGDVDFTVWAAEAYWEYEECLRLLLLLTGGALLRYLRSPQQGAFCRQRLMTQFKFFKQGILR